MGKNNKVVKEQNKYKHLRECYEEMNDYLLELTDEHNHAKEDMRYMHDFIHYKNLDDEFSYFREHAHEDENSELPFPYLTL